VDHVLPAAAAGLGFDLLVTVPDDAGTRQGRPLAVHEAPLPWPRRFEETVEVATRAVR
jgi:hypothetical protein